MKLLNLNPHYHLNKWRFVLGVIMPLAYLFAYTYGYVSVWIVSFIIVVRGLYYAHGMELFLKCRKIRNRKKRADFALWRWHLFCGEIALLASLSAVMPLLMADVFVIKDISPADEWWFAHFYNDYSDASQLEKFRSHLLHTVSLMFMCSYFLPFADFFTIHVMPIAPNKNYNPYSQMEKIFLKLFLSTMCLFMASVYLILHIGDSLSLLSMIYVFMLIFISLRNPWWLSMISIYSGLGNFSSQLGRFRSLKIRQSKN